MAVFKLKGGGAYRRPLARRRNWSVAGRFGGGRTGRWLFGGILDMLLELLTLVSGCVEESEKLTPLAPSMDLEGEA